jgi:predicted acylesterase/phospholipase RssA
LASVEAPYPGQVVLVLQGGGALGSYQAGVYQALHEAGIEPDWIIGTSIGAINACLMAGNSPQNRLTRLREFWKKMEQDPIWSFRDIFPDFNEKLSYWSTVTNGIPGFFRPNPLAQRNLLYTGVTRGKKLVVLVGQKKAVAIAVRNVSGPRRWSKLREWLRPKPPASRQFGMAS